MGGTSMEKLTKAIYRIIDIPNDGIANYKLAQKYEKIKHWAGALSYYLRCIEYTNEKLDIVYDSLIHISLILRELGNRKQVEEGYLLHALTLNPERVEAYWLLSQLYEYQKKWQESYTMASIGLKYKDNHFSFIEYEEYKLLFQRAVAAWWVGYATESREIFFSLPDYPLDEKYIKFVQNNMSTLGSGPNPFLLYSKDKVKQLKFKFTGCNSIERNYSQTYQDMFVLSILNGRRRGYYLEIGSADPFYGSNTCLLEKQFGWEGISIEIKEDDVKKFKKHRTNPVVCRDAQTINYELFLKGITDRKIIDYLQIDCEPPQTTYNILLSIPFETYKFRVITFEHDYYADASRKYRDLSRKFLKEQGYTLVVSNIAPDEKSSFEDWWVYSDLVDNKILTKMLCNDDKVHQAEKYMLTCQNM